MIEIESREEIKLSFGLCARVGLLALILALLAAQLLLTYTDQGACLASDITSMLLLVIAALILFTLCCLKIQDEMEG